MAISEIPRSANLATYASVSSASQDAFPVKENASQESRIPEKPEASGRPGKNDLSATSVPVSELQNLQQQDRYIRSNLENLRASLGNTVAGSPIYDFQKGPDNRFYAIDGKIRLNVDSLQVPGDPDATVQNLRRVTRLASNAILSDPTARFEADTLKKAMVQRIEAQKLQSEAERLRKEQLYSPAGKR